VTAPAPASTAPATTQRQPTQRSRVVGLALAAALLALTCVASVAIGSENVTLPTVWQALTDYHDIGDQWIVHDLRIPRTVLALLVGLALGLSGTLIQAVGRNPLADSEILGINSGAALFVVFAIAFLGMTGIWTYIWFAFAGALFAMLLVYLVGMTGRATVTPVRVLLAGVAIGAVMDGIGYAVRLRNPRAFDNMRFWDAGAIDGRSLEVAAAIAPFIAIGVLLCLAVGRSLNVTALGDDLAKSMGGNVARTQALSLIAVALLAGAATAGAGPIGFVGLMVPHAVRRFTGPDWRWILAYATVVTPALLLATPPTSFLPSRLRVRRRCTGVGCSMNVTTAHFRAEAARRCVPSSATSCPAAGVAPTTRHHPPSATTTPPIRSAIRATPKCPRTSCRPPNHSPTYARDCSPTGGTRSPPTWPPTESPSLSRTATHYAHCA
jgi:iron complex transport system permease protein